jgi:hypothetical protein
MPIDYKEYPTDWKEISLRIRERDGNKCKCCGIRNHAIIERLRNGRWRYISEIEYDMIHSKVWDSGYSRTGAIKALGFTRVVLTVAHLNHIKHDVRDENLQALCQACHLKLDIHHHVFNRRYGRKARENNYCLNI